MDNNYKLPIPAGIESYVRIVTNCYYIDKTLFIKKIIDDKGSQVTLFTRPRRFGKTLNLDMLKVFFEKTSTDTSKYFKDKLIWKAGEEYRKEQGQYPVIFLTFKDCTGFCFEESVNMIKNVLQLEFFRHLPTVEKSSLNESIKQKYFDILSGKFSISEIKSSILFLSTVLSTIYQKKVVLLIDEYDVPIQYSYSHNYYEKMIDLMRDMFSAALKTNENNLYFGVLTGILRVSKESLFSGLNNINVDSVLDSNYSDFFGFTEKEVKEMLTYYGFEDKLDEIKNWYDGYNFGKSKIYNPWSVAKYLRSNCKAKPYWVDTGSNSLIGKIISKANESEVRNLEKLYKGEGVFSKLNTEVTYKNMLSNESSILSFLLLAGYLTTTGIEDEFGLEEVVIPNKEIKGVYKDEILSGLLKIPVDSSLPIFFLKSLLKGESLQIKEFLSSILKNSISSFDTRENFYHGLILGMLVMTSDYYKVQSNKEEGYGRFDILLMPKEKSNKAIIIELKASNKGERLKFQASKALKQIEDKEYFSNLNKDNCSGILEYGIAFAKKDLEIECIKKDFKGC